MGGPRGWAPPPPPAVPPVGPSSSTAEVVRAAIAAGTTRLLAHDPGLLAGDDPEDVHQARVATRRLRSDLRTFRDQLDPAWASARRDELGWLAGRLGAVRDADVLLERLRSLAGGLPAADAQPASALLGRLEAERGEARGALLEALASRRYAALLDALVVASNAPHPAAGCPAAGRPASKTFPPLVRHRWRRLEEAVAGLEDEPDDPSLHQVRILAKRCRYAAEASIPVAGKDARRLAEALAKLQGVLGDLNDAVVAEAWLRRASDQAPRRQALVAGQLIAAERAQAVACRAAWPAAWKASSSKRLRGWLER